MQDRFKVRVWNTLVKEFSYFDKPEMQIGTGGFDNGLIFPLSENSNLYMGKYLEPQFCTGLKDKNGKLIYEGDIVKISPSGFFDNNRDVFCIKFTDGYRLAYQDWQTLDTIGGFSNKLFEIIGNIYETPELLKDGE